MNTPFTSPKTEHIHQWRCIFLPLNAQCYHCKYFQLLKKLDNNQISYYVNANLWFYIQQSDFALLVDLLDGLDFGAEHVSLEAAVFQ